MTTHYWRKFFLTAMNPVYYEGQPFIHLSVFCSKTYPAIAHLKEYNELHILILAWLILQAENEDEKDQWVSAETLCDLFKNTTYRTDDFAEAIDELMCKNWLAYKFFDKQLFLQANCCQAEADHLLAQKRSEGLNPDVDSVQFKSQTF